MAKNTEFDPDAHVYIYVEAQAIPVPPAVADDLVAAGKVHPGDMPDQYLATDEDATVESLGLE